MYVKLNQVNHPLLCGGKTPGLYLREIPSVVGALPVVESGRERSGCRCLMPAAAGQAAGRPAGQRRKNFNFLRTFYN